MVSPGLSTNDTTDEGQATTAFWSFLEMKGVLQLVRVRTLSARIPIDTLLLRAPLYSPLLNC